MEQRPPSTPPPAPPLAGEFPADCQTEVWLSTPELLRAATQEHMQAQAQALGSEEAPPPPAAAMLHALYAAPRAAVSPKELRVIEAALRPHAGIATMNLGSALAPSEGYLKAVYLGDLLERVQAGRDASPGRVASDARSGREAGVG